MPKYKTRRRNSMAKNYVMAGYTTPAGVTDSESVKKMQQMLGVKADGIWGRS
jgi:hypothetical protein